MLEVNEQVTCQLSWSDDVGRVDRVAQRVREYAELPRKSPPLAPNACAGIGAGDVARHMVTRIGAQPPQRTRRAMPVRIENAGARFDRLVVGL